MSQFKRVDGKLQLEERLGLERVLGERKKERDESLIIHHGFNITLNYEGLHLYLYLVNITKIQLYITMTNHLLRLFLYIDHIEN